jgi:hypothetical protein
VALSLVNFVTGFILVNADFVLQASDDESVANMAKTLVHIWRLFPPFLLGEGLVAGHAYSFPFPALRGANWGFQCCPKSGLTTDTRPTIFRAFLSYSTFKMGPVASRVYPPAS